MSNPSLLLGNNQAIFTTIPAKIGTILVSADIALANISPQQISMFMALDPGEDGYVLTADSSAPLGLSWAAGGGGNSDEIVSPDTTTSSVIASNTGITAQTTGSGGYTLTSGGATETLNSSGAYEFLGPDPAGGYTVFSALTSPNGYIEFSVNEDENTYLYMEEGYYEQTAQGAGTIEMQPSSGITIEDDSGTTILMQNNNYMSLNSNWIEITIPGIYTGIDMQETSMAINGPDGYPVTINGSTIGFFGVTPGIGQSAIGAPPTLTGVYATDYPAIQTWLQLLYNMVSGLGLTT